MSMVIVWGDHDSLQLVIDVRLCPCEAVTVRVRYQLTHPHKASAL
jgi:hypothetical protein